MKTTAALVAAVVVFLLATLPPKPASATWAGDPSIPGRTVAGAYHVHSRASDGAGDRETIAASARRAGIQFVIITDHGDGTDLEAPAYIDGVLCIDAVEISTNGGHYVALGMERAPYPLGGEPFAVVEDVTRLHGFGFAAHPDSPKPALAWTDWGVAFDGIEWMSADSEWRNESRPRLARVLFDYWFRPAGAMASVLDRPSATLARWDALSSRRPLLALAGHDAHGGVGTTAEDGKRTSVGGIPSYEASFRSFSTRVVLDAALSGNAEKDAVAVLTGIRNGHAFTTIDALAGPGFLDFAKNANGGVTLQASAPAGSRTVLLRHGDEVDPVSVDWSKASGAYRVEVRLARAPGNPPIPWLVSNALYFLPPPPSAAVTAPDSTTPVDLAWHVEKDPGSDGDLAGSERDVSIDFRLRGGEKASQFVALAGDFRGARGSGTVLVLDGSASRPMRVSAQLRYPGAGGAAGEERWARSIYLESASRQIAIPIEDLLPVDGQTGPAPPIGKARSLIFVIDLVNASPGSSGNVRIANVAIGRLRALHLAGPGSDLLEGRDQVAGKQPVPEPLAHRPAGDLPRDGGPALLALRLHRR
jgi:hypothetical protein